MKLQKAVETTILPSRTRYQLRHFVAGQHETPAAQYKQIIIEAERLAYDIAMAELDCKRKQIQIERLIKTGDELDAIEAEENRLGLVLTERKLAGARMEMAWLAEMAEETGHFTVEQIEADQPEYWQLRLSRQAGIEQMAAQEHIGAANLTCMLQIGMLSKEGQKCLDTPPGN